MKTIIFLRPITKRFDKIAFLKTLRDYDPSFSLKQAKDKMDAMIKGTPFELQIDERELDNFLFDIHESEVEFEVK